MPTPIAFKLKLYSNKCQEVREILCRNPLTLPWSLEESAVSVLAIKYLGLGYPWLEQGYPLRLPLVCIMQTCRSPGQGCWELPRTEFTCLWSPMGKSNLWTNTAPPPHWSQPGSPGGRNGRGRISAAHSTHSVAKQRPPLPSNVWLLNSDICIYPAITT